LRIRNPVAVGFLTIALLVGPMAGAALAHVEVSATPDATQGGAAALTFKVPSEKDLPTIAVEIALPTDAPVLNITVPPIDGWTLSLVTAAAPAGLTGPDGQPVTEIVSSVVWSAIGVGIAPEESVDFVIEAGMLPAVDRIAFPASQTYSDGSVVSWAEQSADGASEPDFPAPLLFLAAGSAPATPTPSLASSAAPAVDPSAIGTPPPATVTVSSSGAGESNSSVSESTSPPVVTGAADSADGASTTTILVVAVIVVALLAGGGYALFRRSKTRR